MKKPKKHFLYNLFNPQGNGNEIPKDDLVGPDDLPKCFKLIGRNITNLLSLNLMIIFGNFPLMFALFALTGNLSIQTTAPSSMLFAPLYGVMQFDRSPVLQSLYGVLGLQTVIYTPTVWTYVCTALTLLILFTNGYVCVGANYVLRGMVRRDPISLWSDFWGAIRRNKKQGLIMGIIDAAVIGILIYNIATCMINPTLPVLFWQASGTLILYLNYLLLALYMIMRFYIYILLITFDLSIWKIIKNSLIFTFINLKRNILALTGIILAAIITWVLFAFFMPGAITLAITFLFSVSMFFGAYAAYPKIKEIMIDPQMNSDTEE
ncbi:MAG: DUF624 domain-containing protein [Clostridia bacterium]|nr:DUF624 domain-containing protein [Clostridia bacterium]